MEVRTWHGKIEMLRDCEVLKRREMMAEKVC